MPSRGATADQPDVPIPDFFLYIQWAISSVFGFAGGIAAAYLTLDRDGRLPHERFLLNVLAIGAIFALVGGLSFASGIVGMIFGDDSGIALLWYTVTGLALLVLFIYLLMEWLGFGLGDFAWFFLFYTPVVQIIFGLIGYFFRWGVYALVL